jgi:hypothetical protein
MSVFGFGTRFAEETMESCRQGRTILIGDCSPTRKKKERKKKHFHSYGMGDGSPLFTPLIFLLKWELEI